MTTAIQHGGPEHGTIVVGCEGSQAGLAAMDCAVADAIRGDARLMAGSTRTEVVHHSHGPVLVVPCPQS